MLILSKFLPSNMVQQHGQETTKEQILIAAAKLIKEEIRSSTVFESSEAFPDVKNIELSKLTEGIKWIFF